jgi:creatinine amidohydrolase
VFTSWWRLAGPELLEISETGPGGVGHGGELETSMIMAIAPELVRVDLIPDRLNSPAIPFDDADLLRGSRATLYRRSIDIAATGVFGEPKVATVAKGRRALEVVGDRLDDLVRSLRPTEPVELPAEGDVEADQREQAERDDE